MSTELLTDDTIAKLRQLNVSYDFFDWLQDGYEDLHTEYNDLGLEIYNLSNGRRYTFQYFIIYIFEIYS